jgi:hypothetical protein
MTRDEAILWLRARGYHVSQQYSEVNIYASKAPVEHGRVRVLDNALVIHPSRHAWAISRYRHGGGCTTQQFQSLEEAVRIAQRWIDAPPPWPEDPDPSA